MTVEIPLMHKGRAEILVVDESDLFWVMRNGPWCVWKVGAHSYAMRNKRVGGGWRGTEKLHRLLLNVPGDLVVDHIDGNGLNNSRCNLRICTQSQNAMNKRPGKRYKGVVHASRNSYAARIRANGKLIALGSYPSPELAANAYNEAAKRLFGDFAGLNNV